MFVDLDWPQNASSLLSASAELLVLNYVRHLFLTKNVLGLESSYLDGSTAGTFKIHSAIKHLCSELTDSRLAPCLTGDVMRVGRYPDTIIGHFWKRPHARRVRTVSRPFSPGNYKAMSSPRQLMQTCPCSCIPLWHTCFSHCVLAIVYPHSHFDFTYVTMVRIESFAA